MTAQTLYVIDGYNLLHRLTDLKGSKNDEMEDRRLKLIRRLIGFSAGKQLQFHLVFDAPPDRRGRENHPGVRVDYASPSADDFIRYIIAQNQGSR
ncbi:NYN domain-containing protein, partial [bacterium]|nr:NYN domain-containing protein [bacterium]